MDAQQKEVLATLTTGTAEEMEKMLQIERLHEAYTLGLEGQSNRYDKHTLAFAAWRAGSEIRQSRPLSLEGRKQSEDHA